MSIADSAQDTDCYPIEGITVVIGRCDAKHFLTLILIPIYHFHPRCKEQSYCIPHSRSPLSLIMNFILQTGH